MSSLVIHFISVFEIVEDVVSYREAFTDLEPSYVRVTADWYEITFISVLFITMT